MKDYSDELKRLTEGSPWETDLTIYGAIARKIAREYQAASNGNVDTLIQQLIQAVDLYSGIYYNNNKTEEEFLLDKSGYMANTLIITVANIAASEDNKKAKIFILKDVEKIIPKSLPKVLEEEGIDVIKLGINKAREIVQKGIPDYTAYA